MYRLTMDFRSRIFEAMFQGDDEGLAQFVFDALQKEAAIQGMPGPRMFKRDDSEVTAAFKGTSK